MEKFVFEKLPRNLEELKLLKEAELITPFQTAALTILSLNVYSTNEEEGIKMINFLKGPVELTPHEISFLKDRFRDKKYVPKSYFDGATPENNYEPIAPITICVNETPYSYEEEGYAKLFIRSGGADSDRPIKLRQKGKNWYLWEQMLLSDIKAPVELDPWA